MKLVCLLLIDMNNELWWYDYSNEAEDLEFEENSLEEVLYNSDEEKIELNNRPDEEVLIFWQKYIKCLPSYMRYSL